MNGQDKVRSLLIFNVFMLPVLHMYCSMTGMIQDDPMPNIYSRGCLYSIYIELWITAMCTARVLWVLTLKEN